MTPQTRNPAGGRGFGAHKRKDERADYATLHRSRPSVASTVEDDTPTRARIPALLRHHASFVDTVMRALCAGEAIGLAGRRAMAYTADRLRQMAGVLE